MGRGTEEVKSRCMGEYNPALRSARTACKLLEVGSRKYMAGTWHECQSWAVQVKMLGSLTSGIMALFEDRDRCIVTPLDRKSATLKTEDTMSVPLRSRIRIFQTGSSSFTIAGNSPSCVSFSEDEGL